MIIDADGNEVTSIDTEGLPNIELGVEIASQHPDRSARVILADYATEPRVFPIGSTTTELGGLGDPVTFGFDYDGIGRLIRLEADTRSGQLIAVYAQGIALWRIGEPLDMSVLACSECSAYEAAAIDPFRERSVYAACTWADTRASAIVRLSETGCELILDGSTQGNRLVADVTTVRAEL